jgi:prepilin-type N-terminal cleavage/methylation domain-containing protein
MNRMARQHGSAGFTLVEMLVVVVLLGLLAGAITAGVRFGVRAWNRAERQSQDIDDVASVEALLRRMIATAVPSFATTDPSDFTLVFDGAPNGLLLVGSWPGSVGQGPWARLHLFVAPHGRSHALYLSWTADQPPSGAAADDAPTTLLLDHVATLRLAYFGAVDQSDTLQWSDNWTGRAVLPELIRVSVVRDDPALRQWPDLIAAPRATANATCGTDAILGGCRKGQ